MNRVKKEMKDTLTRALGSQEGVTAENSAIYMSEDAYLDFMQLKGQPIYKGYEVRRLISKNRIIFIGRKL